MHASFTTSSSGDGGGDGGGGGGGGGGGVAVAAAPAVVVTWYNTLFVSWATDVDDRREKPKIIRQIILKDQKRKPLRMGNTTPKVHLTSTVS